MLFRSTSNSTRPNSILPEPIPTPRKSKPDLKPAPLKSTSPSAHKSPLVSAIKSTPPPLVTTPPNDGGPVVVAAVKEARKDILKAQEQGVLVPPPADAGRVAKLYHQAKQLFVRLCPFLFSVWLAKVNDGDRNFIGMDLSRSIETGYKSLKSKRGSKLVGNLLVELSFVS